MLVRTPALQRTPLVLRMSSSSSRPTLDRRRHQVGHEIGDRAPDVAARVCAGMRPGTREVEETADEPLDARERRRTTLDPAGARLVITRPPGELQREPDGVERAQDVVRDAPRELLELGCPMHEQLLVALHELGMRTHRAMKRDRARPSAMTAQARRDRTPRTSPAPRTRWISSARSWARPALKSMATRRSPWKGRSPARETAVRAVTSAAWRSPRSASSKLRVTASWSVGLAAEEVRPELPLFGERRHAQVVGERAVHLLARLVDGLPVARLPVDLAVQVLAEQDLDAPQLATRGGESLDARRRVVGDVPRCAIDGDEPPVLERRRRDEAEDHGAEDEKEPQAPSRTLSSCDPPPKRRL